METLREVAREADQVTAEARTRLIAAIREASAQGLSQQQIAAAVGRSQPEVSRLLRFHGSSPVARKLRAARQDILAMVKAEGGSNVRVFGSVATGADNPVSDVDLVFTMGAPLSLMELTQLERRIADVVGVAVDLVPESALRPDLRDRILAEAIAL